METWVWGLTAVGPMAYALSKFKDSDLGKDMLARLSGHPRKPLLERNRDIILSYIGKIQADGEGYNTDNLTRDCISEIAQKERRPRLVPRPGERLYQWEKRADIPSDWLHLKDRIKAALNAKHSSVVQQQAIKEEETKALRREQLYLRNQDLVEKFFEIAERKVSIIDEYGEENWDALPQEIETCVSKIAKRNGHSPMPKQATRKERELAPAGLFFSRTQNFFSFDLAEDYRWLSDKLNQEFREYHGLHSAKPTTTIKIDGLSGVEFETLIGRMLRERGFDVLGTPATGDQGADLIAKKDGRTIIIQAKCYQGSVGNKAVQEVISALIYYGGDEGWVITNSFFTTSAKALAQKSNVKLIDGRTLEHGRFD